MVTKMQMRTSAKDAGLAQYMSQIFNYMTAGVALSGLVAWITASSPALMSVALNAGFLFLIVWFGFGFFMHRIVFSLQPAQGLAVFAAFSALTGFTLAPIAYAYTGAEIVTAFFTAATMFAGASLYGYSTKKSLSGWGNFLMMGAWGLVGAIVVNLLVSLFTGAPISGLSFVISLLAVPLFAAMTAFETNQLKSLYYQGGGDDVQRSRMAILGANSLYMNFIVMFLHILNLLGMSRN